MYEITKIKISIKGLEKVIVVPCSHIVADIEEFYSDFYSSLSINFDSKQVKDEEETNMDITDS